MLNIKESFCPICELILIEFAIKSNFTTYMAGNIGFADTANNQRVMLYLAGIQA